MNQTTVTIRSAIAISFTRPTALLECARWLNLICRLGFSILWKLFHRLPPRHTRWRRRSRIKNRPLGDRSSGDRGFVLFIQINCIFPCVILRCDLVFSALMFPSNYYWLEWDGVRRRQDRDAFEAYILYALKSMKKNWLLLFACFFFHLFFSNRNFPSNISSRSTGENVINVDRSAAARALV